MDFDSSDVDLMVKVQGKMIDYGKSSVLIISLDIIKVRSINGLRVDQQTLIRIQVY